MPGDNVSITVADRADRDGRGLRFAIREGGRTVGAGVGQDHRVRRRTHVKSRRSASAWKGFDKLIDQSALEIVDTAKRTGAIVIGPVPPAHAHAAFRHPAFAARQQDEPRPVRDPHAPAPDGHRRPDRQDRGRADEARPARPAWTSKSFAAAVESATRCGPAHRHEVNGPTAETSISSRPIDVGHWRNAHMSLSKPSRFAGPQVGMMRIFTDDGDGPVTVLDVRTTASPRSRPTDRRLHRRPGAYGTPRPARHQARPDLAKAKRRSR